MSTIFENFAPALEKFDFSLVALIGGHIGLASDIIGQVDVQRKLVNYRKTDKPTITSFRYEMRDFRVLVFIMRFLHVQSCLVFRKAILFERLGYTERKYPYKRRSGTSDN